ncbi:hypothetical protein NEILACOT_03833 [Neisseria lactamica ATCC 23970]|uniref:Uncharacterized protein n=1 Tax=Neisseria lactamica ATCC 23970 TaxID=546265 RepID=D0W8H9_NEILA|nr:hypothetical protein NEILACOT_03833 [Neisseria lactamica ATCC 23970]
MRVGTLFDRACAFKGQPRNRRDGFGVVRIRRISAHMGIFAIAEVI